MSDNKSNTAQTLSAKDQGVMKELGITHEQRQQFHVGKYSYSTLDEAVAQAERQNRDAPQEAKKRLSKGFEPAK